MSAHLDTIARELAHAAAAVNQAISRISETDHYVQRSVAASARGGFAAMAANLQAAQQQVRVLHGLLNTASDHLGRASAPIAAAPKEVDAGQMLALLGPLPGHIDHAGEALSQARAQTPSVIQRIAASANRNPAIGILTDVGNILDAILRQAAAAKNTVAAARADAKSAQSGE